MNWPPQPDFNLSDDSQLNWYDPIIRLRKGEVLRAAFDMLGMEWSGSWLASTVERAVTALKANEYRWIVLGNAFKEEAERDGLGMPCRFSFSDDGQFLGWDREGSSWKEIGAFERKWMDQAISDVEKFWRKYESQS